MTTCAVALFMLLDVSGSYTQEDWRRQVEGHARAFESAEIVAAIQREQGVAVRAMAFADVPTALSEWHVLRTQAEAAAFAAELRRRGFNHSPPAGSTQTGYAIERAMSELNTAPCQADQQVVDVVTDGVASDNVRAVRDAAQEQSIRINGLFVHTEGGAETTRRSGYVDGAEWMRDNVITEGGTLSRVNTWDAFMFAIRAKIVWEIASR